MSSADLCFLSRQPDSSLH